MDSRSPQTHVTISNEVKQHNLKFGGAPASAVNDYSIPLYTHADPDEFDMRIRGGVTLRSHAKVTQMKKATPFGNGLSH
ncbi:hypothetical protein [Pseudomonas putida]|uniref:hypothetical protein n=1 Tax=Pseudomonas putida TaxID=303 RepID=UPI002DBB204A|nr:hypothetical protein [Pseudomonas putida]WRW01506.1 hypothetical protein VPZ82_17310 [Pseudomonas putida]